MTDRPAQQNDRVSEIGIKQGLNVSSAGLNPCHQEFNNQFNEMLKSQLGKITGLPLEEDLLREIGERIQKKGFNLEDIASDPENHQKVLGQAFKETMSARDEENH